MATTGQFFFATEGGGADTRIAYVNNDPAALQTILVDNNPTPDLITSNVQDIGLDTAAGFYFAIVNGGNFGSNARLVRGSLTAGGPVTEVASFVVGGEPNDDNFDDIIVNSLHVDAFNQRIYLGYQDPSGGNPGNTGIRQFSYDALTGAVTDLGFLVTVASSAKPQEGGFDIFNPRDFDFNPATGEMLFTELLAGGVEANGLFRLNVNTPNAVVQVVSQTQFPDNGSNGFIIDVELDTTTNLAYFNTQSSAPSPDPGFVAAQNKLWYVAAGGAGATATELTITGLPDASIFFPGDLVIDQATRQLYVESEQSNSLSTDDVIYVLQLDAAGTSATFLRTIAPSPTFASAGGNVAGMAFNALPTLAVTGTATAAVEQSAAVVLLASAPTITDIDGDSLASATVQITGGTFVSNESSRDDDNLAVGSGLQTSGLIAGTNITVSFDRPTSTLRLTGYDTIANYQAALAAVRYFATGDNPTNYGNNPTRTVTFTVSDGAVGVPAGSQNSGTTTLSITAVNDAPVVPGETTLTAATEDDQGLVGGNLLAVATDPDSLTLSIPGVTTFLDAPTLPSDERQLARDQFNATLSINTTTGALSFNPRALKDLDANDTARALFSYSVTDGITFSLATAAVLNFTGATSNTPGDDIVTGRDTVNDQILTGNGNDSISGLGGDDILAGEGGNDQLNGGPGNDVLVGGAGEDALSGGTGLNILIGGPDNDSYIVVERSDSIVEVSGGGTDSVSTGLAAYVLPAEVEQLTYTGIASFVGIGNDLGNEIRGGESADQLAGRGGNDTLFGGTGAANTLIGDGGDDTYRVDAAGDSTFENAGEGTDEVITTVGVHTLRVHVENLTYAGTASFIGIGNDSGNRITGGAADDFLSGFDGGDILIGGNGADFMIGGDGADQFRYLGGETGIDRIFDFQSGVDQIALVDAGFANTATVNFVSGPGVFVASDGNSTFFFNTDLQTLSFDADGNGAGEAVVLAIFSVGATIVAGDIIFV